MLSINPMAEVTMVIPSHSSSAIVDLTAQVTHIRNKLSDSLDNDCMDIILEVLFANLTSPEIRREYANLAEDDVRFIQLKTLVMGSRYHLRYHELEKAVKAFLYDIRYAVKALLLTATTSEKPVLVECKVIRGMVVGLQIYHGYQNYPKLPEYDPDQYIKQSGHHNGVRIRMLTDPLEIGPELIPAGSRVLSVRMGEVDWLTREAQPVVEQLGMVASPGEYTVYWPDENAPYMWPVTDNGTPLLPFAVLETVS